MQPQYDEEHCRYDGWVTELKDQTKVTDVSEAAGIDNLLYSSDVDFSCFADLAVVSPVDYRKEGEGSLMQARPAGPAQPPLPLAAMLLIAWTLAVPRVRRVHAF
jgi:zeta-carotene desaturase